MSQVPAQADALTKASAMGTVLWVNCCNTHAINTQLITKIKVAFCQSLPDAFCIGNAVFVRHRKIPAILTIR
ncbi:MAG: hypothetical protein RIQ62_1162 [Bacteroidota bacterium]